MSENVGYAVCQMKIRGCNEYVVLDTDQLWRVDAKSQVYENWTKESLEMNMAKTKDRLTVRTKIETPETLKFTVVTVVHVSDTREEATARLKEAKSTMSSRYKRMRTVVKKSDTPTDIFLKNRKKKRWSKQQREAALKMRNKKRLEEKRRLAKNFEESKLRQFQQIIDFAAPKSNAAADGKSGDSTAKSKVATGEKEIDEGPNDDGKSRGNGSPPDNDNIKSSSETAMKLWIPTNVAASPYNGLSGRETKSHESKAANEAKNATGEKEIDEEPNDDGKSRGNGSPADNDNIKSSSEAAMKLLTPTSVAASPYNGLSGGETKSHESKAANEAKNATGEKEIDEEPNDDGRSRGNGSPADNDNIKSSSETAMKLLTPTNVAASPYNGLSGGETKSHESKAANEAKNATGEKEIDEGPNDDGKNRENGSPADNDNIKSSSETAMKLWIPTNVAASPYNGLSGGETKSHESKAANEAKNATGEKEIDEEPNDDGKSRGNGSPADNDNIKSSSETAMKLLTPTNVAASPYNGLSGGETKGQESEAANEAENAFDESDLRRVLGEDCEVDTYDDDFLLNEAMKFQPLLLPDTYDDEADVNEMSQSEGGTPISPTMTPARSVMQDNGPLIVILSGDNDATFSSNDEISTNQKKDTVITTLDPPPLKTTNPTIALNNVPSVKNGEDNETMVADIQTRKRVVVTANVELPAEKRLKLYESKSQKSTVAVESDTENFMPIAGTPRKKRDTKTEVQYKAYLQTTRSGRSSETIDEMSNVHDLTYEDGIETKNNSTLKKTRFLGKTATKPRKKKLPESTNLTSGDTVTISREEYITLTSMNEKHTELKDIGLKILRSISSGTKTVRQRDDAVVHVDTPGENDPDPAALLKQIGDEENKIVIKENLKVFKHEFIAVTEQGTVQTRVNKAIEALWDRPTRLTMCLGKRINNNYQVLGKEGVKAVIDVCNVVDSIDHLARWPQTKEIEIRDIISKKLRYDRNNDKKSQRKKTNNDKNKKESTATLPETLSNPGTSGILRLQKNKSQCSTMDNCDSSTSD